MGIIGTGNDITLSVGFDYSKAISQDAPRAAAELQKVFSGFGGKNKNLIEPLGRISSSTTEFAKSLEAANARVIAFGASVGIIYNIQKAFVKLVESTVQVEKKLMDVNVVLGVSSSRLKKFSDDLFDIANQTGKSFQDVSDAAIEFSRQGLGVEETLKRTKDALVLTRIAGIDTKDAVDALTAGVNSFSKSLIDSTQIVNKFAAVDAAFAVSSQDLAEALRRVGSSAQDAGVDLDQLAGLVTAVQQTTARGGAVIGNALKTIFSRLSRGETIRELKDLGVQIDESQNGIEKLKALSAALNNVSGTQASAIKEAAGGVYQINVVSAALGDLSKQYGVYEQALNKSKGATDEAISRNKELNTTLSALATQTENNLTKAFSKIGNLSIDSPFRTILGLVNDVLEPMGKVGDEGGSKFGENFFKGLGKFIEGPGLTYIGFVGLNLTKALVGFAGQAFKQLQSYNKNSAQLLATRQGISLELERDVNLTNAILSGNMKVADAQALIIQRLQQDLALRQRIANLATTIAPSVIKSGVAYNTTSGLPERKRTTFASGFIPSPTEVFAESIGAQKGGYIPGKVKVRNIPGLGRAVYNDNEKVVNFPGMAQPAIMPPQNSKAGQNYGMDFKNKHGFNPYNIPNFSNFQEEILSNISGKKLIRFNNSNVGSITLQNLEEEMATINYIRTIEKGKGHSSVLYGHAADWLKARGYKGITGELIKQGTKPNSNAPIDRLMAGFPQFSRGKHGIDNEVIYDDIVYSLLGGDKFKNDLKSKAPFLLKESGDPIFNTYFKNKGLVPNFAKYPSHNEFLKRNTDEAVLKMLQAYPAKFGSYKQKYLNVDLPQGNSKVRYSDAIDPSEFEKKLYDLVSKRGFVASNGLIPNFSGLAGAIKRESQSVPMSTIKVGMDSRLKSSANPSGIGVYNTIHEPNGLQQGINRAYSEGLNPKTYNIPNFVPTSKFIRGKFETVGGSNAPESIYNKIQSDIKSNLRDLFKQFESGALSARKMTDKLEELKTQFNLTDNSLLKVKSAFSKFKKEVQIDKDFNEALITPAKNIKGQYASSVMAGVGDQRNYSSISRSLLAGNLGMFSVKPNERAYKGLMGQFEPENYRSTVALEAARSKTQTSREETIANINRSRIFTPTSTTSVFSQQVESSRKAYYDQERIKKRLEKNKQEDAEKEYKSFQESQAKQNQLNDKISGLRKKADSFNFFAASKAIKEAERMKDAGSLTGGDVEELRQLRRNRISTGAGIASFALPTLITPALQGLSDNKKYQAGLETVSGAGSLALTGLSVGAAYGAKGGAIGAAAGGALGLLSSLPGLIKAFNDPLPDLANNLEKLKDAFNNSSANAQQYISLTEKISEIQAGNIKGIKNSDFQRLSSERERAFSSLGPNIQKLITEANKKGDFVEANRILGSEMGAKQSRIGFGEYLNSIKDRKLLSEYTARQTVGLAGAGVAIPSYPIPENIEKNNKFKQEVAKGLYEQLTGLSNVESGKNVFQLVKENSDLQSQFSGIKNLEDLQKTLESINKTQPLEDFTTQFSDFEEFIKKNPAFLKPLLEQVNKSLSPEGIKQAIKNSKEIEITIKGQNKTIDSSITKLIEFNSNLENLAGNFQMLNQGKLLDLETAFNLDKIKLGLKTSIESLNAGDYAKAGFKFSENEQERKQKRDLGLETLTSQTNQEYLSKISDFQGKILSKGIQRLNDKKQLGLPEFNKEAEKYSTAITNLFNSAGLDKIDFNTFGKNAADSILEELNKNSQTINLLSDEDKRAITSLLPELKAEFNKIEITRKVQEAQIRKQYESSGILNNAQLKGEIDLIGATNFDRLNKLRSSNTFENRQFSNTTNFEQSQQLQRIRDEFNLSNLAGGDRLQASADINSRNILSEYNFKSSNLLPNLLQQAGKDNTNIEKLTRGINTKQELDNLVAITKKQAEYVFATETQKDNYNVLLNIQEQLRSEQEKLNIAKDKGLDTEKKSLDIQKELLKYRFQDERISDNLKNIEGKIRVGGGLSGQDIKSTIKEQFNYGPRDFQRDAILGVNEVSSTIKTSFSGAISSIIKDGKSFGDAFREMLLGVLNKIVDKTSDITTNMLFSGLSSAASSFAQGKNKGGIIRGYSTGGSVKGGSGMKDDVPAMLTDGEYVIKKSAVNAIGKSTLDKINYGDSENAVLKLKNDFTFDNPKYPTTGKLDVSSALSNFGIMDTSISRTNELRLEKEQGFYSYLEQKKSYDKNVSDAMKAFRQQKRNRLYGAYLSAAVGVAGAGLSSVYGSKAGSGTKGGVDFNGFQYAGATTAANGGMIQKFANGGHVFGGNSVTDTIPAMLTGGEYVIKKDKVNKFGKSFFDALNYSSIRKYADGGLVSAANTPAINGNKGLNTDLTIQFNSLTNAINNLSNQLQPNNTNKDNYGINNYITVSVSVDGQNNATTESSVNSQSKGSNRNENDQSQVEKLRKGLENDMGAFINKQMKQGGTIYTFVNGRIGR